MKPYVVIEKAVGETPLACVEDYRSKHPELDNVPMAYAGRLDPMASGKLLVLQGEECKVQEKYHNLDKEYEFEVLFGVGSDTADVLGLLQTKDANDVSKAAIEKAVKKLIGDIELPYPHFSSKTVQGKPLHVWTLEGRLGEITIPTKRSTIYTLKLRELKCLQAQDVYKYASEKIETIPKVTDASKALGNDFRRDDVRKSWKQFRDASRPADLYFVVRFVCIASSGTYMRTLANVLASELGTAGLAYSIHRTKIGIYKKLFGKFGYWKKLFK
jgi:tRNA pseudouridine(55) synthase